MSILESLVHLTERVEGLNGVHDGLKKLIDADGAVETAAAASQLAAELAITTAVTATVRTSMSALRLGLAISGQIWKWEALSWAAGAGSGLTAGAIIDWVNDQNISVGSGLAIAQLPLAQAGSRGSPICAFTKPNPLGLSGSPFEWTRCGELCGEQVHERTGVPRT